MEAQIDRYGLAQVAGEIQPLGCIMAGEATEPTWQRVRREKRAAHKAARREGGPTSPETEGGSRYRNEREGASSPRTLK